MLAGTLAGERRFQSGSQEISMTAVKIASVAVALSLAGFAAPAQAGCLKGAIVGGLAGKLMGHGYAGAAAGCAYGHYRSKQDARRGDLDTGRSVRRDGRY